MDEVITPVPFEGIQKALYKAKGVVGPAIAFLAVMSLALGVPAISGEASALTEAALQFIAGVGSIVGIVGRIMAKTTIV